MARGRAVGVSIYRKYHLPRKAFHPLFLLSLGHYPPTPSLSYRQAGNWKQLFRKTRVLWVTQRECLPFPGASVSSSVQWDYTTHS